jgi:hypothetical protein
VLKILEDNMKNYLKNNLVLVVAALAVAILGAYMAYN